MDLNGKVAIVTGGARGIGYAITEALMKKGCKVAIVDVINEGETSAKKLNAKYGVNKALFVRCDVTVDEELRAAFEETIRKLGPLSIVANNAGIHHEDWKRVVAVNLVAVIKGVELGFEYMGKDEGGNGGVIINTASVLGFKPMADIPVYVATKHGVVGLTRSYGMPYHFDRTGVAVKAICPTTVNTEMLRAAQDNKEFYDFVMKNYPPVQAPYVAEGFMKLLQEGENGATLHVAEDGYHYVKPDLK